VAKPVPSKTTRNRRWNSEATKSLSYEALSALNQHFEQVLKNLKLLRQLGLFDTRFRRESVEACQATIEETRAWANFEIVEILHEREERDRAHFGGLRFQWEKRVEDPQDVLIQAELLKRKLPAKKPSRG
jgi:HPt (histidine-containing phosphotransfer) domain-containing protein